MQSKSDIMLNEQDSLRDMLECEKQLMGFYATAIRETSTRSLRKEIFKHYSHCSDGQFSLFEEMLSRGYYQVQPAQKQQLDMKLDSFKKTEKQLTKEA